MSSSKDKKILNFAQFRKYTYFLEKSYTKCKGEASPRSFYKKTKQNSEHLSML